MIEKVFQKEMKGLRGRSWKIVHHSQVCEDIVQNAFVKALEKGEAYFDQSETKLVNFLNKVVDNLSFKYLQHLKVRRRNSPYIMRFTQIEIIEVWDDVLRKRLQELLPHLPPQQRAAFDLIFFQEMTSPEASMVMAINESTVRVHYKKAVDYIIKNFRQHSYPAKYQNGLCI